MTAVTMNRLPGGIQVNGNFYEYRSEMRKAGFEWQASFKCWLAPKSTLKADGKFSDAQQTLLKRIMPAIEAQALRDAEAVAKREQATIAQRQARSTEQAAARKVTPATAAQISYLRKLGWTGDAAGLTIASASSIIDSRRNISAEDNDDFKN